MDNLLEVGQVVNTYGIKGFVKVVPLVDNNNQFNNFKVLYIESNKKQEELNIEEIKFTINSQQKKHNCTKTEIIQTIK